MAGKSTDGLRASQRSAVAPPKRRAEHLPGIPLSGKLDDSGVPMSRARLLKEFPLVADRAGLSKPVK